MRQWATGWMVVAGMAACLAVVTACPGPGYPLCSGDQHCAQVGQVCVYGQCHACALDEHCPAEQECRSYKCQPRRMCTTNADCKEPLVCREDQCVPECTTDAQCTDGKACKDNRCIAREDAPPACQAHTDCASGQACRDGACVVPKEGDADYEAVYGTPAQPPPAEGPASGLDAISGRMLCGEEVRVFFGFNESMLNEDAREMLQRVATCLKKNPSWNVTILGHTDSRGSTEYNLALGERRALAVRLYLKDLGLDPKRAVPVSAGEERPLDPGQEEAAWAKNRRAELLPRQ